MDRMVLTVDKPGLVTGLPGGRRVFLEWHPSKLITGPDRRAWLGRVDEAAASAVANKGDKVPVKGMSCDPESRNLLVLAPGEVFIWRERAMAPAKRAATVTEVTVQFDGLGSATQEASLARLIAVASTDE